MDTEIQELRRAVEIDPADEAAARRYDKSLERSGARDLVRERFEFKFRCPMSYDDLTPLEGTASARHCGHCDRYVYQCVTKSSLAEHVALGHCVSIPARRAPELFLALTDDPRFHSARTAQRPCVLPGHFEPNMNMTGLLVTAPPPPPHIPAQVEADLLAVSERLARRSSRERPVPPPKPSLWKRLFGGRA